MIIVTMPGLVKIQVPVLLYTHISNIFGAVLLPFFKSCFSLLLYRAAQIELFHALAAISNEHNLGQGVLVKIKFNIIASLYDYNPNLAAFMKVGVFSSVMECVRQTLQSKTYFVKSAK